MPSRMAVLGAGSWGTTLAVHLGGVGHEVALWGRSAELVRSLRATRQNATYLPGIEIPAGVHPTDSLEEAVSGADCVISAIPSHGTRRIIEQIAPRLAGRTIVVSATKGLEPGSLRRMSQVMAEVLGGGHPVGVLSGPSFAAEVARRLPTAVCVASADAAAAQWIQQEFRASYFRLYVTDDVTGVEVGGALKNVIAIAAGVNEALGLGQNALAALITRGLAEMSRLACALGGRRETLSGLSGLGDLVLTCTGSLSRNRRVGIELGEGRSIVDIVAGMQMVAEGVKTAEAALALGRAAQVELPITAQMSEVLAGRKAPRVAVEALMLRPQRPEPEPIGS